MRSPAPVRATALTLLLGACVSDLLTLDVEQSGSTVVEGGGLVGAALGVLAITGFDDLSVAVDQELANQGVAPGDIASVYLTALTLSTPDGDDLAFLESLTFLVESPGLPSVRIAYADAFPEGVTSLPLKLEGVDLTAYVVAESMTITTVAEGTLPEEDTTVDADMTLAIEATAQGACNQAERAAAAE